MAELIVALVEAIAALVELGIHIVAMVLGALGFSVGYLADKPKEGERRFSANRLLIAFVPFAMIASLIVGAILYMDWRSNVRRAKEDATQKSIEDSVEQLAGSVDENGQLIRHPAKWLAVEDAWGNKLQVKYHETLLHSVVSVRSNGADEKANTTDDLSSSRQLLRPKSDIAKGALVKVKDAIRDRIRIRKGDQSN